MILSGNYMNLLFKQEFFKSVIVLSSFFLVLNATADTIFRASNPNHVFVNPNDPNRGLILSARAFNRFNIIASSYRESSLELDDFQIYRIASDMYSVTAMEAIRNEGRIVPNQVSQTIGLLERSFHVRGDTDNVSGGSPYVSSALNAPISANFAVQQIREAQAGQARRGIIRRFRNRTSAHPVYYGQIPTSIGDFSGYLDSINHMGLENSLAESANFIFGSDVGLRGRRLGFRTYRVNLRNSPDVTVPEAELLIPGGMYVSGSMSAFRAMRQPADTFRTTEILLGMAGVEQSFLQQPTSPVFSVNNEPYPLLRHSNSPNDPRFEDTLINFDQARY